MKDGGVLVGRRVGLGPGVNVGNEDENEKVGGEKGVGVFVGPTVNVGMADTVSAIEVRKAADVAVLFTSVKLIPGDTGMTFIPQAARLIIKRMEMHRWIIDFVIIAYTLVSTVLPRNNKNR